MRNPIKVNQLFRAAKKFLGVAAFAGIALTLPAQPAVTDAEKKARDESAPVPLGETVILSPFTVTAATNNAYLATNATSGTRIALPLESTPMTINVVTADLLKDKGWSSVNEATRFMPGVRRTANNSNQIKIRGFQSGAPRVDDFFDAGDLAGGRGRYELAEMERIELVKGPTTVLFGFGNPGGVLNMLTKRPLSKPGYAITAEYGSYDSKRVVVDATGPVAKRGDWEVLYRVIGVKEDTDGFRDFENLNNDFISGQIQLNYRNTTSLRMRFRYQDIMENAAFNLLPYDAADGTLIIPPDVGYNVSGPDGDFGHYKQMSHYYELTHVFSPHVSLRAAANFHDSYYNSLGRIGEALRPDHKSVQVLGIRNDDKRSVTAWQTDLTGNWNLSLGKLRVVVGMSDQDSDSRTRIFLNTAMPQPSFPIFDIAARDYRNGPLVDYLPNPNDSDDHNTARVYYGLASLETLQNRLTLMAGVGRGENTTFSRLRVNPNAPITGDFKVTKPQFGASFQLLKGLHLFGNSSESASPNPRFPGSPEQGKSYDVGLKANYSKFSGSLTYFDTTRESIQVSAFNSLTGVVTVELSGEEEAQGIEADLQYFPTPQMQFVLSHAWTNSRVVSDNQRPGRVGTALPDVPRNALRLWGKYTFKGGALDKFWVGFGYMYTGQMIGNRLPDRYRIHTKAWDRYDASLGYTMKAGKGKIDYVLSLENLADDKNYVDYGLLRGKPFNAKLSATLSF